MSATMALEEKFKTLMKSYQFILYFNEQLKNQNEYLRHQSDEVTKQTKKALVSPSGSVHGEESEAASNPLDSLCEEEPSRRPRRDRRYSFNSNNFRVEISKFEGKPSSDEFLEGLHMVERIFDYEEVPEEKKVKCALKLRMCASLQWTNRCIKRVRNLKEKIRAQEKMKTKLKSQFLLVSYLQDSYSHLYNLTQGTIIIKEYIKEFEKLLIKYDIQEAKNQTIVRYLGGLDPEYASVVELQKQSTFDEVCVLAHKVEQ